MKISQMIGLLEKIRVGHYGRDEEVLVRVDQTYPSNPEDGNRRIRAVFGERVDHEDGTQRTYVVIKS